MIAFYPLPQLMQCVSRVPNGLWGVSRYNRGYKGPTVQVRRSSDGAAVDCYSLADIAAHCAGSNGFAVWAYDQTGQARQIGQLTGSKQPKVYDSVTGVRRAGSFGALSFVLASSQNLVRDDGCGFAAGNVAYTLAYATSAWAFSAGSQIMMQLGPDTGGALADTFYAGRNTLSTVYNAVRLGNRSFTNSADPTSARTYFVARKAAGANIDAATMRQNSAPLAEAAHASATLAYSPVNALTCWGCSINVQQYCQATSQLAAAWDIDLTGTDLTNLERVLETVRVA